MGSYAFFNLAGLYPLPATRQFLLSSPYFPSISFYNPFFDKTATFKITNFESANSTKIFVNASELRSKGKFTLIESCVFHDVQGVKIDGKRWHSRCYIEWDVFERGSTVEIEVTDDISLPCGETVQALPPSLSTGGYT
jgi:putative alpha-1,2-mannosidase